MINDCETIFVYRITIIFSLLSEIHPCPQRVAAQSRYRKCRRHQGASRSRRPTAVGLQGVAQAVVQPAAAALPGLPGIGAHR